MQHTRTDPHASRAGGRQSPPQTLEDRDAHTVLTEHFFPPPEALAADLPQLEELREEQQRHITQQAEARAAVIELNAQFAKEDEQHEARLASAFAEGTPLPAKDKRTPTATRQAQLSDAQTRTRLAFSAAHSWAQEALADAREQQNDWLSAISTSQAPTRQRIEELNAELNALKATLARDQLLEAWVKRLDNPTPGLVLAYGHLQAIPGADTDADDPPRAPLSPFARAAWRQTQIARGLPA